MSDGTDELTLLLDELLAEADNGQNMTRAAMLAERISELFDTLRAQLSEAQARLAEIEAVCRRLVARRNSDGGYTVLTIDIESLEELLAAPVSPAAQVAQGVADDVCPHCAKIVGPELAKRCAAAKQQNEGVRNDRRNAQAGEGGLSVAGMGG